MFSAEDLKRRSDIARRLRGGGGRRSWFRQHRSSPSDTHRLGHYQVAQTKHFCYESFLFVSKDSSGKKTESKNFGELNQNASCPCDLTSTPTGQSSAPSWPWRGPVQVVAVAEPLPPTITQPSDPPQATSQTTRPRQICSKGREKALFDHWKSLGQIQGFQIWYFNMKENEVNVEYMSSTICDK